REEKRSLRRRNESCRPSRESIRRSCVSVRASKRSKPFPADRTAVLILQRAPADDRMRRRQQNSPAGGIRSLRIARLIVHPSEGFSIFLICWSNRRLIRFAPRWYKNRVFPILFRDHPSQRK